MLRTGTDPGGSLPIARARAGWIDFSAHDYDSDAADRDTAGGSAGLPEIHRRTTTHFRSEGDVFRDSVRLVQATCPPPTPMP